MPGQPAPTPTKPPPNSSAGTTAGSGEPTSSPPASIAATPCFRRRRACWARETRMLRLAAELAGHDTGQPLADLLANLDDRNARIVADAIAHALRLEARR